VKQKFPAELSGCSYTTLLTIGAHDWVQGYNRSSMACHT